MSKNSIAIYGAGAIGLDLGVHLIEAGHRVSFIARNETKSKLASGGIIYESQKQRRIFEPNQFFCTDDTSALDHQDYIFLTIKADDLLDIGKCLEPLIGQDTVVISATNGIPPWYSYLQDRTIGRFLNNTGPRDEFLNQVAGEKIVGAVIERSVTRTNGNEVSHNSGSGYVIGELSHVAEERTLELKSTLEGAGLSADISDNIHRDIWIKLMGNIFVNPLSVLTEKTIGGMMADPAVLSRATTMVEEALKVGLHLGVISENDFNMEALVTRCRGRLANHETSMLRDYKIGNKIELHRIVEVVIMLAELPGVDIPVPELKSVLEDVLRKIDARQIQKSTII